MVKKHGTFITVGEEQTYLLGLDAGNTVIKAVLFDQDGRQVAMQALDGQTATPAPGHVERDLGELWQNAGQVIRGCIEEAGISARQIAGVGCAGHGNGLYALDKSGAPLIGIQSLDTRAAELAEDLSETHGSELHKICLQKPWPSQTPVLLAWVKRHQPEIYDRIGTVFLCKDFITHQLTGIKVSDISDMSGCGLTRMPACRYDAELMHLYGLHDALSMLPALVEPAEIAGHVTAAAATQTGLIEGTPVIGGYFDVISSALGSGVCRAGEASIIAGTWSVNQVFSPEPVLDSSVFMASGFAPGRFVNIDSSATSAVNLEWYVRELVERGAHVDDPFGQCNNLVAEVTPAPDDPICQPFLYGSGQGAQFRGGYFGLAGWHGEGHLLRALFEGVVFEHRRHIEVLRGAGLDFDTAVLSGGGSRSPHWPQIFADCLDRKIRVSEAKETGALGAAIGVAVAVGLAEDYESAVARMTRTKAEFTPNPSMRRHYDQRYALYSELNATLQPLWARLGAMQTGQCDENGS